MKIPTIYFFNMHTKIKLTFIIFTNYYLWQNIRLTAIFTAFYTAI